MAQPLASTAFLFIAAQCIVRGTHAQCGPCTPGKVFPNPDNPYSFYICDTKGNCIFSNCSPGTSYNISSEECDRDPGYNKGQKAGKIPNWNFENGNWWRRPSSTSDNSSLPPSGENNSSRNSENGVKPSLNAKCNSLDLVFYENSEDCSTFFTCYKGKFTITYCPHQMYFNPTRFRCESSIPSGCKLIDRIVPQETLI